MGRGAILRLVDYGVMYETHLLYTQAFRNQHPASPEFP